MSLIVHGTLQDKLGVLFSLYDTNDDGRMDVLELVQMLRIRDRQAMDMIEYAEEVLLSLDLNGDRLISRWVPSSASHFEARCATCLPRGCADSDECSASFGSDSVLHEVFAQSTAIAVRVECGCCTCVSLSPHIIRRGCQPIGAGLMHALRRGFPDKVTLASVQKVRGTVQWHAGWLTDVPAGCAMVAGNGDRQY